MFSLWATRHLADGTFYFTLETVDTATGDVIQVLTEEQWAEVQVLFNDYLDVATPPADLALPGLRLAGHYLLRHFPDSFSRMIHFDQRLLRAPLKTNIHTDLPPYGDDPGPLSIHLPVGETYPIIWHQ